MLKSILVAYASKSGATVEIAEALGQALRMHGALVDVMPVHKVGSVLRYQRIVLGSAIRTGYWLPEAMNFAKRFHAELNLIPTAIFTVHLLNLDNTPESIVNRRAYTAPVHELFHPVAEAFFAGRLEKRRLDLFEQALVSFMKADDQDWIDWDAISVWGAEIGSLVGSN